MLHRRKERTGSALVQQLDEDEDEDDDEEEEERRTPCAARG